MFSRIKSFFIHPKEPVSSIGAGLHTDIHSHLLPGIDDGVDTFDESIEIIKQFHSLGYNRIITTPHVMQDFYRNEPDVIKQLVGELQQKLQEEDIQVSIDAAAEYYLDETLLKRLEGSGELLTFGNNYLLFETSFINKPMYLEEFIFKCTSQGIHPVMAHPERYAYVHNNPSLLNQLRDRGVLLQINANSITGYYSKDVKKLVRKMIDDGLVNFVGSDCHSMSHMEVFKDTLRDPYFIKVCNLPLLNHEC